MIAVDDIPPRDLFSIKPAWFLAAVLFLLFTLVLLQTLLRILQTRFVLEFTEDSLIDRRSRRRREIPYSLIEIFSPSPEELFNVESAFFEARAELDIEDFVTIACRLRPGRNADPDEVTGDFVFQEFVEIPSLEMQAKIVSRLRAKILRFDHLETDDGVGFGDDETNV